MLLYFVAQTGLALAPGNSSCWPVRPLDVHPSMWSFCFCVVLALIYFLVLQNALFIVSAPVLE